MKAQWSGAKVVEVQYRRSIEALEGALTAAHGPVEMRSLAEIEIAWKSVPWKSERLVDPWELSSKPRHRWPIPSCYFLFKLSGLSLKTTPLIISG